MKATELIGKKAIRTQPIIERVQESGIMLGYGSMQNKPNYLFTDKPIKILKATESHIVYEWENFAGESKSAILNLQYCDDNWINYEELVLEPTEITDLKAMELALELRKYCDNRDCDKDCPFAKGDSICKISDEDVVPCDWDLD